MKLLKKAWTLTTWGLSFYTIYNQMKALDVAKADLFDQLPIEQQEQWIKVFGVPGPVSIQTPELPPVTMRTASDLEKINAGV